MSGQLRQKLTRPSIWLRLVYMIVLAIAFNIAELVIFAVVVFQFLATLFTRKPNEQFTRFGENLSHYIQQIVAYLTFASEEKPFPFAAWPDVAKESTHAQDSGTQTIEAEDVSEPKKAPTKRKPAPRKSSTSGNRRTPPKQSD